MTVIDPGTSRPRPLSRTSGAADATTWWIWTVAFGAIPSVIAGFWAGQQFGTVVGGFAAVAVALLTGFMRWHRADIWLGVFPVITTLIGGAGWDSAVGALLAGLAVGGLVYYVRHRRAR